MQGSFFVRIRRILRGRFVPATGPAASPSPFRYGVGHNPRRARAVPGFVPERLQVRLSRNRNLSGSVPEGLFMGPLRFFRPLVRFGAQYPSVCARCPVCRPVGCMRRTPECPSILPVSSRSPDRTDPKTHARRKSRTKMQ